MDQRPLYTPTELHRIRHAINAIDLGPIRYKLMDPKDGEGWSRQLVDQVDLWYRRFLFLSVKARAEGRSIVPNKLIDEFWHYHILDTEKYAADCERAFGFFLHHFPYFGMRGEDDAARLIDSFDDTMALFVEEFGESPASIPARVASSYESEPAPEEEAAVLAAAAHCANACTTPCEGGTDRINASRPTA